MKKTVLLSFLTTALAASVPAFAQTAKFEGISAALSASVVDSSFKMSFPAVAGVDGGPDMPASSMSAGTPKIGTALDVAYSYALNKQWVLGLGAKASLTNPPIFDLMGNTAELKNQKSIYIQPAFVLTANTAVYAKVSYDSAKFEYAMSAGGITQGINHSVSGIGFGVGVKSFLNDNVFVQVEMLNTNYGSFSASMNDVATTYKPSTKSLGAALGYRF